MKNSQKVQKRGTNSIWPIFTREHCHKPQSTFQPHLPNIMQTKFSKFEHTIRRWWRVFHSLLSPPSFKFHTFSLESIALRKQGWESRVWIMARREGAKQALTGVGGLGERRKPRAPTHFVHSETQIWPLLVPLKGWYVGPKNFSFYRFCWYNMTWHNITMHSNYIIRVSRMC